ncbi:hypothetical protein JWH04_16155 [Xanthomonas melonis]|uniref:hypothetical protein n=1 Tax=Xanthomonas melonis TaxID=56456 RepID=UPI001E3A17A8|nr:hypothetical protein [Xanthomonas melonis]MCD0280443.1 hypothetical protein [Xanthomonas melonis]
MLPEGFQWIPRYQYADADTAVALDGEHVASLIERVDGGWFARLELQKPFEHPLVTRRCTSLEAGRAGIEMWVCRHEQRLRAEVAAIEAARPRHCGAG